MFIGIETPNAESLRETKKRQNLNVDLVAAEVDRFVAHGVAVIAGMIVGFDADGPDVFRRQYEFAMATPVPIFSLGALVAPEATPLYARLAREGRLVQGSPEVQGVPWNSNIAPMNMSSDELRDGLRWLSNALYAPAAFGERMLRFIDRFGRERRGGQHATALDLAAMRAVDAQAVQVALAIRRLGEARMSHAAPRLDGGGAPAGDRATRHADAVPVRPDPPHVQAGPVLGAPACRSGLAARSVGAQVGGVSRPRTPGGESVVSSVPVGHA